jgi:hypothetical protein
MWIERKDDGRAAKIARFREQALDQAGVAMMDAVEVPDRERAALQIVGEVVEGAEETQGWG